MDHLLGVHDPTKADPTRTSKRVNVLSLPASVRRAEPPGTDLEVLLWPAEGDAAHVLGVAVLLQPLPRPTP
jgi:hypothetical protein